ncbi:MAG TPA: hypothetical protein VGL27_01345 [Negativicutes bacterium]|jgi:hypothetical protein
MITPVKQPKQNVFLMVFDVIFIMVLCFATLLSTMLMRGKVIVGSGSTGNFEYSFDVTSFIITIGFLAIYLAYIIVNSDKELRQMISNTYDGESLG